MTKQYRVGIIGAGNIGAQFDQSHARAYSLYPQFHICGFVDIDSAKAKAATRKWGGRAYLTISEFITQEQPQIISVCTPDNTHALVVKQLQSNGIIGGILEKPLAPNLVQAETLIRALPTGSKFLVNYSRLFVPEFRQLQDKISKGKYGRLLTGTGYYGKGLFHNGSHLIGLLLWFFGSIKSVVKLGQVLDFTKVDPSISAALTFAGGSQVVIQAVNRQYYSLFELDLLFEQGRIRIIDSGFNIEMYQVAPNPRFKGYRSLIRKKMITTSLDHSLQLAVSNLSDWIKGKKLPLSTVHNAFDILKACSLITNSK